MATPPDWLLRTNRLSTHRCTVLSHNKKDEDL